MKEINEDLNYILQQTAHLWQDKKSQHFFITGGTGFFGKWLISSFIYINHELNLDNTLIILSRNPEKFLSENPHFGESPYIKFLKGDIREFNYPTEYVDYIIHAATEANVKLNVDEPLLMYDVIVDGTKRILEFAKQQKVKAILHTSSGAVYGQQPAEISYIEETYNGCPDIYSKTAAYGEGKRIAEMLASLYYTKYNVYSIIARCYAFVGPYLPLDGAYAVGNFINDVLNQRNIVVKGDGAAYRSYLYAADLVIWLWTILFKGKPCYPYNVGSDKEITIAQLANLVSSFKKDIMVEIKTPVNMQTKPLRYVPSIKRAVTELDLSVNISLEEAVAKTLDFYKL